MKVWQIGDGQDGIAKTFDGAVNHLKQKYRNDDVEWEVFDTHIIGRFKTFHGTRLPMTNTYLMWEREFIDA